MTWSRRRILGGLAVVLLGAAGAGAVAARGTPVAGGPSSSLDDLRWMAGCWERRDAGRTTLEMWMPPDGNLMLGASRTVVGGSARAFEHLRIRATGDTLVYTALPSGQRETSFRGTSLTADGFTVENPAHDFPRRISYARRGADSLVARIEGPGPDGTTRGIDFPMRRIACAAAPD
jgi:hypothetical protein